MSATILIKRTQGTSPPTAAPVGTGVSFGELIYTYDVANVGAGKSYKKLYIGDPSGNTEAPIPIGGEYYTQVIADNPADFGKPVANKAVILNSDAKVSSWTVATDLLLPVDYQALFRLELFLFQLLLSVLQLVAQFVFLLLQQFQL